jgi:hypothetical protein
VLLLVALVIFHRPLLFGLGRVIAIHFAAKENLKLDFRLEGNLFTNLTVRNLHAVAIGPSDIESIDVDLARADYGFLAPLRHGLNSIRTLEARSARIVLNPGNAILRPRPPDPKKKITLPDFFPERVHVTDATVIVKNQPHDFVMEHVDLDLDPRNPGAVKIDKVQLVGGQTWSKISAQTTYANKNLVLHDVVIADNERIRSLSVDASQIAARKLAINLDYPVGGGNISGSLALSESKSSLRTDVHLRAANVPAGVINKYAALPEDFIRGQIEKLDVDLSGLVSSPHTWTGAATAQVRDFRQEATAFDRGVFQVSAKNGTITLQSADIVQGQNQFHLRGTAQLPKSVKGFGRDPAALEFAATAPDLQQATEGLSQKLSGSAQINGKIDINNGKLNGDFAVSAAALAFENGTAEKLNAAVKFSKVMPPPDSKKAWYVDLRSDTTLNVTNGRFRDYTFDSAEAIMHSVDDQVTFERSVVRRKQNEFAVQGEYRLPKDFGEAMAQPAKIDLSLKAVELGDYWNPDSPDRITGPVQINGQIEWNNGVGNGQVSIYGSNLRWRGLVFRQLSAQYSMVNSVVYLNDFTASLNERDFVSANMIVDLRAPYHYSGKISANITNLAVLMPLLRAAGNENVLAGSFALNWEGSGEAKTFKNSGKLKVVLEKGHYASAQALQANIEASYTPEGLDVPIIFFGSDKMDFQANMQAKGSTLEISKIQVDQGQNKYAAGYISIPFIWKNIGTDRPVMASDGKVVATFQSENLDLKKLFEDVGAKPIITGIVNTKLEAHGTLSDLAATLELQAHDLRYASLSKLDPATFDLSLRTEKNELSVNGKLQQSKIQPITLEAKLPFNAAKVIRARGLDDQTPITAKIDMPRSSVNFVRQFVPELEQLDGDVALSVNVNGTIADPVLSGSGDMTINRARAMNVTIPSLSGFKARLGFNRNTLTVDQFGGDLAGGPFKLSGNVTFVKLTEPILDLHLTADSVLVARNDAVTARVNADIKIAGPFNSANVTGNVAFTNSQFLKNIDLIPIGLPGRPAPQPPSSRPDFSLPDPPLRDWKFDVAIKTKDQFLIRGNMANGGAIVDLHLLGTGARPGLKGIVRLENVEATLPFSRMDVSYGFLYFDPSDSLNPKIELHGTSLIRDYTVHVYVYGSSLEPEAVFTSEPPLPQEEIISLLATGTTREELTGNNNVLAGRAAMLLAQQLYRKVFKKGANTKSNTVFDRLDVDVGQVDPRTGQQTASARFKLNKQFVLTGDVEVGGDFRGMLKYLIRFR